MIILYTYGFTCITNVTSIDMVLNKDNEVTKYIRVIAWTCIGVITVITFIT